MKEISEMKKRNGKIYREIKALKKAIDVFVNDLNKLDKTLNYDNYRITDDKITQAIEGNYGGNFKKLLDVLENLIDLKVIANLNIMELSNIRNKKMNEK